MDVCIHLHVDVCVCVLLCFFKSDDNFCFISLNIIWQAFFPCEHFKFTSSFLMIAQCIIAQMYRNLLNQGPALDIQRAFLFSFAVKHSSVNTYHCPSVNYFQAEFLEMNWLILTNESKTIQIGNFDMSLQIAIQKVESLIFQSVVYVCLSLCSASSTKQYQL